MYRVSPQHLVLVFRLLTPSLMVVRHDSSDIGPALRSDGRRIDISGISRLRDLYAGNFLKETQSGRNLNYWVL
jgi:hypothetical protein